MYINTVPKAPTYGNSTLIDEIAHNGDSVYYPLISYYYESSDTPEKLLQFYSHDGICELSDSIEGRFICNGKATPFGEYTVYIDSANFLSEQQTSYILEIRWRYQAIISL